MMKHMPLTLGLLLGAGTNAMLSLCQNVFFFSTEFKYWVLLSNIRHAGILLNFERDVTLFGQFVGMTLPRYRVYYNGCFCYHDFGDEDEVEHLVFK